MAAAKAKAIAALAKALGVAPGALAAVVRGPKALGAAPAVPPKKAGGAPPAKPPVKGKGRLPGKGKAAKKGVPPGLGKKAAAAAAAAAAKAALVAAKGGGAVPGGLPALAPGGVGPLAAALGFGGVAPPPAALGGAPPAAALPAPPIAPPGIPPVFPPPAPGVPKAGAALGLPAAPVGLGGAAGGIGVYTGGGAAAHAGKPPTDLWIDVVTNVGLPHMQYEPGDIFESTTRDAAQATINGTWLWKVLSTPPSDAVGRFLEVECLGASSAPISAQLQTLFPSTGGVGVVHLCCAGSAVCGGTAPGRQVLHIDQLRRRNPDQITEPWYQPSKVVANAAAASLSSQAASADAKICELRDRLLRAKVEAGTASIQEQMAYNLSKKLKKEEDKKRKKKKKAGNHSDSSGGGKKKKQKKKANSSDSDSSQVFGTPLSCESVGNPIIQAAHEAPGALFNETSLAAARQTGARGRGGKAAKAYAATGEQWLNYVKTVLTPQFPQGIPAEVMRELMTLASALEFFQKGELGELGDLLVQRLKSVELSLSGNTEAANAVQLIGLNEFGLTNSSEMNQAQKFLRSELKMAERARAIQG